MCVCCGVWARERERERERGGDRRRSYKSDPAAAFGTLTSREGGVSAAVRRRKPFKKIDVLDILETANAQTL